MDRVKGISPRWGFRQTRGGKPRPARSASAWAIEFRPLGAGFSLAAREACPRVECPSAITYPEGDQSRGERQELHHGGTEKSSAKSFDRRSLGRLGGAGDVSGRQS